MQLKINKKYQDILKKETIKNIIIELKNRKPDFYREKERRKIWHLNYNSYNIFIKNFNYPNLIMKKVKGFGLKNYIIANFFLKNKIKTPEPLFYLSTRNNEYFATFAISNSIDLWEFLSKNPSPIVVKKILNQIKYLLAQFETLNIYHSDFNIRNLILDQNSFELYILDLEAVRMNLNRRRYQKMVKKINKYLGAFNLSI